MSSEPRVKSKHSKFEARGSKLSVHKLHQMWNLGYHSADSLRIWTLNHLVQPGESQAFNHQLVFFRGTNRGAHPFQLNLSAARIRLLRRHFKPQGPVISGQFQYSRHATTLVRPCREESRRFLCSLAASTHRKWL